MQATLIEAERAVPSSPPAINSLPSHPPPPHTHTITLQANLIEAERAALSSPDAINSMIKNEDVLGRAGGASKAPVAFVGMGDSGKPAAAAAGSGGGGKEGGGESGGGAGEAKPKKRRGEEPGQVRLAAGEDWGTC